MAHIDYIGRIKFLLSELSQGNRAAFARILNVDRSAISHVLNGRNRLSKQSSYFLSEAGVNLHWLETGEGEPFIRAPGGQQVVEKSNSDEQQASTDKKQILQEKIMAMMKEMSVEELEESLTVLEKEQLLREFLTEKRKKESG